MLFKSGIYYFKDFQFPHLVCAVSSKEVGDIKEDQSLKNFSDRVEIDSKNVVQAEQVHGNKIKVVGRRNAGKKMVGVDGLITKEAGLFLLIKTADCYPIIFLDEKLKIVGLAHTGWRGTTAEIVSEMVKTFKKFGSDPTKIKVAFGPGICVDHYQVGQEFEEIFKDKSLFKGDHFDLLKANLRQLMRFGVKKENIEVSGICTYENRAFFSWRRDKENKLFGTIVGFRF